MSFTDDTKDITSVMAAPPTPASESKAYVFTEATLGRAMDDWITHQINSFPHQKEQIEFTAKAMNDFFYSEFIDKHKMKL